MGGDDELGLRLDQVVDAGDHSQLTAGRECGFWFVQQIQSLAVKAIYQQGQKRFAMQLLVQSTLTVRRSNGWPSSRLSVQFLDFGGHVKEAFGAEEESIPWTFQASGNAQVPMQLRGGLPCSKSEILRAAFCIKAAGD